MSVLRLRIENSHHFIISRHITDLYFVYNNVISLSLSFLQDLLLKVNDLVSEQKKDVRFGAYSTVEVRATVPLFSSVIMGTFEI